MEFVASPIVKTCYSLTDSHEKLKKINKLLFKAKRLGIPLAGKRHDYVRLVPV